MERRRLSRRVFFALLAAVLWLGFLVDGSHALFADQVSLTGNSITSGTTNLLISNSQNASSTVYDKSRVGFSANLNPGDHFDKFFLLKNSSSGNLDFSINVSALINSDDGSGILSNTVLSFSEVDSDGNLVGIPYSASLLMMHNGVLQTGFIIPSASVRRFKVTTSLAQSQTTQGSATNYDLIFTGTQIIGG